MLWQRILHRASLIIDVSHLLLRESPNFLLIIEKAVSTFERR